MLRKCFLHLAWIVVLLPLSSTELCLTKVHVDENFINQTCTQRNYGVFTCRSLAYALTNPKFKSNTCIYVQSNITLNESIDIYSADNLSIESYDKSDSNSTKISCNKQSAIRFYNSQNITIIGLTFEECGDLLELNWSHAHVETETVNISAAVVFIQTTGIRITDLIFQSSQGYALAFNDANKVSITRTHVSNSSHVQIRYRGRRYELGGGVFIHWQQQEKTTSNNAVDITNSHFMYSKNQHFKQITEPIDDLPYEKGAGLAIFFGYRVQKKLVRLENVTASNNCAGMGAGVYVHFADGCGLNTVECVNVTLERNVVKNYGGALFVHHDSKIDNVLSVKRSKLNFNEASVGGAVCLVYFAAVSEEDTIGRFSFAGVEMSANKAQVGAAMHAQNARVDLEDVNISYSNALPNQEARGQGTVYALRSQLTFKGDFNVMKHNNNSALILDSSDLQAGDTTIAFYNNFGYNGGALAFYEHSRLKLSKQAYITFAGNFAANKGGGIYVLTPGPSLVPWHSTELNMYGCFIEFFNTPFTGRVSFNDNTCLNDNRACDIFTSSLQSCAAPADHNDRSHIISGWKNFKFYSNSTSSITTNAITMRPLNMSEWISFPGDLLQPRVVMRDERQNDIRESINVAVEPDDIAGIETNPVFVVDKGESIFVTLLRKATTYSATAPVFKLRVKTTSDVFLEEVLTNVTFKPCRFGYTLRDSSTCVCDVLNNEDCGIAVCDSDHIYMERNRWVDPLEETSHICPSGYCYNNLKERFNRYVKDSQCAGNRNQSSRLCSECKSGLSVTSASSKCIQCDHASRGWIGVTLVIMVGLSVFIVLVMVLNIDIMSFNINICLYSFQIIDILYANEQTIDPFLNFVMSIFQTTAWNSEMYPTYCMWDGMNMLHKTAYGYLIPGWMFVFMVVLYFVVRNNRSWMERWFKTLSIVLMMCFSDLLRVSFELLHSTGISGNQYLYKYAAVGYFGREHLPYAISAIIVLIVVLFLSVAQIIPLLHANLDLFEWLRKFEDNVSHYFVKGKKWFWIFYFVCRVEIYAVGIFLPNFRKVQLALLSISCFAIATFFALQHPFKDDHINLVETIVLTTLAIISVLSMGIRNVFSLQYQTYFRTLVHVLSYVPLLAVVATLTKHVWQARSKGKMHQARRASTIYHPVRVFESYEDHHPYQRVSEN